MLTLKHVTQKEISLFRATILMHVAPVNTAQYHDCKNIKQIGYRC